jgi:hypothetical protein
MSINACRQAARDIEEAQGGVPLNELPSSKHVVGLPHSEREHEVLCVVPESLIAPGLTAQRDSRRMFQIPLACSNPAASKT